MVTQDTISNKAFFRTFSSWQQKSEIKSKFLLEFIVKRKILGYSFIEHGFKSN